MNAQKLTPKVQDRTQQQCERILDAAEECFIKYGFHAASMANISEAANMSAGLIYRYFANKNAIILAIIERQLRIFRDDISTLTAGGDLIELITKLIASWQSHAPRTIHPALFIEMAAHASRDPQIDEAMTRADKEATAISRAWLHQNAQAEKEDVCVEKMRHRDFLLKCLIDGLAIRAVRDPNLDPNFVAASLKLVIPFLVPNGKTPAS